MNSGLLRSGLLVGLVAWLAFTQPQTGRFLRPSQDSIVDAAPLSIVARGSASAKLALDGRPLKFSTPAPGVLTAMATLAAGRHELTLEDETGSSKISFFVRDENASTAPEGWKVFRVHPPPQLKAECKTCHPGKDGQWTLAGASVAASCFQCHQQKDFAAVHTHEPAVLRDCNMCHSAHGSTEPKHLKMAPRAACEQCHPL